MSFNDLVEIGDEYKTETWKHKVDIDWPFQVGIAVYLFAKLWVLQFHYDCLDKFAGLIQIQFVFRFIVWFFGRGGAPIAVGQVLHMQNMFLLEQMERVRAWLVKVGFKGTRVIALCRKFYFGKNEKGEKVKLSSKGVQQHLIKLHWNRCNAALEAGRYHH